MPYPEEIIIKAQQELGARREYWRKENARRRETVLTAHPHITDMVVEMRNTGVRLAQATLYSENPKKSVEELGRQNLALQKRLEEALLQVGYTADYLREQHDCMLCRDSGYVGGKACVCFKNLMKQYMYERIGGGSALQGCSFETFSLHHYENGGDMSPARIMGDTYRYCVSYADGFSRRSESLLFSGGPGLGKTHLSVSIARRVIDKGVDVLYTPFQKLINRLESVRFSRSSSEYEEYLQAVTECELLVLDDVGAEFSTSFVSSLLYDIVNSRLISGTPTIISTNLTPDEINNRYGARLMSRLFGEYKTLLFRGDDIRIKKRFGK